MDLSSLKSNLIRFNLDRCKSVLPLKPKIRQFEILSEVFTGNVHFTLFQSAVRLDYSRFVVSPKVCTAQISEMSLGVKIQKPV